MSRSITPTQRRQLLKELHVARMLSSELDRKFAQLAKFFGVDSDDDGDISMAIWSNPTERSPRQTEQLLDELLRCKQIEVRDLDVSSAVVDRRQMLRSYFEQQGESGVS